MAIRVVEFSSRENWKDTQRKLLNFENWVNGDVLKIGHHFSKESDLKIDAIKKCQ